jgi:hypothetical protein
MKVNTGKTVIVHFSCKLTKLTSHKDIAANQLLVTSMLQSSEVYCDVSSIFTDVFIICFSQLLKMLCLSRCNIDAPYFLTINSVTCITVTKARVWIRNWIY